MTLAIAHRGEPIGHIENTLDSFQAAIDAGAPMVEIDVRLTADGRPVVIHDADLRRIWGVDAEVSASTRAAIEEIRIDGSQRIPDLAEVVELAVGRGVQLMVDVPAAAAGVPAFELIRRMGALDICLFAGETHTIRERSSTARIALSWEQLAPPDDLTLGFYRPEYFNPHFQLLTATIADRMHEAGILVSVWTVDDVRDMRAVLVQGADAITTNRIADLLGLVDPA